MRCPVMQLSATVEGMDITDCQAAGTARAVYLTVDNCGYALGLIRQRPWPAGCAVGPIWLARSRVRRQSPARTGATGVVPVTADAIYYAAGRRIPHLLIRRGWFI
jgi:hypothetical protein